MRIRWQDQFKEDYQTLIKSRRNTGAFRKALNKAISLLQANKDPSKAFPTNRLIKRGEGWFDCYITSDIVMIYRIQGQSVKLTAIGPVKAMYDR